MPSDGQNTLAQGRIVTRFGADVLVRDEQNQTYRCTLRRKFDDVATGDWVEWQKQTIGNGIITKRLKRKNLLQRPDFRGVERPVAANIDVVFVVMSWYPEPNWHLLDRYLIYIIGLAARACIVMNKSDLTPQSTHPHFSAWQDYRNTDFALIETCTVTGEGCDLLRQELGHNETAILVGQSGVGKSSLVKWLLPDQEIRIGANAQQGEGGKHTTTNMVLYELPSGGEIIDSPGIREFTLSEPTFEGVQHGYPEISSLAANCKFHNCKHLKEPQCAVVAAVTDQTLSPRRYERYRQLIETCKQG